MNFKQIFKIICKNFLSVLIGAICGVIISVPLGLHFWLPKQIENLSFGISMVFGVLALIIITVIFFSILGIIIGGILGIIIYHTLIKKSKK